MGFGCIGAMRVCMLQRVMICVDIASLCGLDRGNSELMTWYIFGCSRCWILTLDMEVWLILDCMGIYTAVTRCASCMIRT